MKLSVVILAILFTIPCVAQKLAKTYSFKADTANFIHTIADTLSGSEAINQYVSVETCCRWSKNAALHAPKDFFFIFKFITPEKIFSTNEPGELKFEFADSSFKTSPFGIKGKQTTTDAVPARITVHPGDQFFTTNLQRIIVVANDKTVVYEIDPKMNAFLKQSLVFVKKKSR